MLASGHVINFSTTWKNCELGQRVDELAKIRCPRVSAKGGLFLAILARLLESREFKVSTTWQNCEVVRDSKEIGVFDQNPLNVSEMGDYTQRCPQPKTPNFS